jgi:alcohol dehydrogenase class IV
MSAMPASVPQVLYGPSSVTVGRGALAHLGQVLAGVGVAAGRVLVVTDVTLTRLGLATRVLDLLTSARFEASVFSEITGEPTDAVADAVAARARQVRPDAVVGIGGGSALDMAKLAAAAPTNPGPMVEYFAGRPFTAPPVPLVLVPTTAGTGAEASRNAVITRGGVKVFTGGPHLVARAAILDPELTVSLPPAVTAWTGMDAMSHCLEAMLSTNATPLTDAVAAQGLQLIRTFLPRAYADGADVAARAQMLVAAFLGGVSLNAGMVLGHSIAYTLANRLHLAHGLSCALALPACIAYNAAAAALRGIARALGVPEEPAAVLGDVLRLEAAVGIATAWRDVGVRAADLPAMVDECLARYPRPNNPRPLERDALLRLYERAWAGALLD